MKTSNTELEQQLTEVLGFEWPLYFEDRKKVEALLRILAQSQTNLLDRVEKALPEEKELAPNGMSERIGFNQAITEVRNSLNQIRRELGNEQG